MKTYHNIDEILTDLCSHVLDGETVKTRGFETKEIFPFSFCLEHPNHRCIINPIRKWNLPLALGELAWHLDGSDNVNQLTYYAKNWENFAEDGRVIESCYGKKIFKGSDSQWNRLIDLFKNDPNSRRGVLSFYNEQNGLDAGMIDVSCTISIQFILRNKRLDAITFMRSNDLIWGIPYDVFLFTMLQELLANELEVEVGKYFHHVGSLHVYKRHYRLAEAIRDAKFNGHHKMPLMREGSNSKKFIEAESAFRNGLFLDFLSDHGYWDELANVLSSFKLKKDGRISEAKNLLNESNYKPVMEPIF